MTPIRPFLIFLVCSLLFFQFACKKPGQSIPSRAIYLGEDINVQKLFFQNSSTVFACGGIKGSSGGIYKSLDGGYTWQKIYGISGQSIYNISFINDTLGYATGEGLLLLKTIDGGVHWQEHIFSGMELPPDGFHVTLHSIHCISADTTYICGGDGFQNGISLKSFDRGRSWSYNLFEHELRGLAFLSKNKGLYSGYGAVFQTTDSASTFQQLPEQGDFYMGLAKVDQQTAYLCGYNGGIYRTQNAGQSWSSMLDGVSGIASSRHFNGIGFYGNALGYAVGNNGLILYTGNAGSDWSELRLSSTDNFYSVSFNGPGAVFITGQHGNIYLLNR